MKGDLKVFSRFFGAGVIVLCMSMTGTGSAEAVLVAGDLSVESTSHMESHIGSGDLTEYQFALFDNAFYSYDLADGSTEYTKYEPERGSETSGTNPFDLSGAGDSDAMVVIFVAGTQYTAVLFDPVVQEFSWRVADGGTAIDSMYLNFANAIPEPASLALLAAPVLAAWRRRN